MLRRDDEGEEHGGGRTRSGPDERLAEPDDVGLAMENAQIQRQEKQHRRMNTTQCAEEILSLRKHADVRRGCWQVRGP